MLYEVITRRGEIINLERRVDRAKPATTISLRTGKRPRTRSDRQCISKEQAVHDLFGQGFKIIVEFHG